MAYRLLEHTADLGIEATATSLAELFAVCLEAFTDCLTCHERVASVDTRPVSISAADLQQLMVEWLGEALYLHETEALVLAAARVRVEKVGDGWSLTGEVQGEVFELERHGLKTLIKAVTYHQLAVERRGDHWFARIIFDI